MRESHIAMGVGFCLLSSAPGLLNSSAFAQVASSRLAQQLRTVVPDEQDLQGFTRTVPAGEVYLPEAFSQSEHKWYQPISPEVPAEDDIRQNVGAFEWMPGRLSTPERADKVSRIERNLYSSDGVYHLQVRTLVCASPAVAAEELKNFRRGCSRALVPGSLTSNTMVGEESWVPELPHNGFIAFRAGKVMVFVLGNETSVSARKGISAVFPAEALEAAAYQVLLRASQDPE